MRVLCFGDSNTYGYDPRSFFGGRFPADQRWVSLLAGMTGWEVINAGENGREIPRRQSEIQRFLELLERATPDYLIVMLGGNDLLQGASPKDAAGRMEAFLRSIDTLTRHQIILIGPPPKQLGEWVPSENLVAASRELSIRYAQVANTLGIGFVDAGKWNISLCYDGVHFTEAGHRAFATGLYQALSDLSKPE